MVATPSAEAATPTVETKTDCSLVNNYDWDTRTAHAICMAESTGNPSAHNYSDATADDSYGLFQINLYGDLATNRPAPAVLLDAPRNVEYAYHMYKVALSQGLDGFSPWSTYKRGEHIRHM